MAVKSSSYLASETDRYVLRTIAYFLRGLWRGQISTVIIAGDVDDVHHTALIRGIDGSGQYVRFGHIIPTSGESWRLMHRRGDIPYLDDLVHNGSIS